LVKTQGLAELVIHGNDLIEDIILWAWTFSLVKTYDL
jgi:hypothetical protein